jgi:primosomal protein N'
MEVSMKPIGIISATALLLLVGVAAPMDARQEKPEKQEEKTKPAKQEQQVKPQHQQQAKPEKQQQAKAPKQEQQAKPEHQQQAKAPKQQQQAKPEHQQQAKVTKQEQQAKPEKQQQQQQTRSSHPPQRTQQAVARQRAQPALRLSARGSGRIPDARFHSNFGHDHYFRIGTPVMVSGYSRFQYGGFWFGFVEPWPSGWYYTDDVYIDYVDDGYYMYNPYYPGTRFAISVVI